ncbi:hypothetical protein [Vibrio crassostreae]|uniref:hypothetical protein n=1 Tax=Vibrio crassostreae TaxID=246167 RepID=UPI000F4EDAA2|nr:hypothetical protein [Vibrio crassostreae]RPF50715.1 hypothetical protein EDB61_1182 [Vibrio crassostreae]
MRQHYFVDWAFGIKGAIENVVRERYPSDLRTWPLLQAFDFENYRLDEQYAFIVLKDKLSGIPAGPDTSEEVTFSVPSLPPKVGDIPIWQHSIRQNLNLRPEDFVFVIPIRDSGVNNAAEDYKLFSADEQFFWSKQINYVISNYKAHLEQKMSNSQPTNVTYNVNGMNSRVNINSTDQSVNYVVENNDTLFEQVRELVRSIENEEDREVILASVDDMQDSQGTVGFVPSYQKFLSSIADHITVFTPVLGALAGLMA